MDKDFLVGGEKYISARRAAREVGYADDYVGQLCRNGSLKCRRIGRSWYVSRKSILAHRKASKISRAIPKPDIAPKGKDLFFNSERYIPSLSAAKEVGYTHDYVGQLARSGALDARMVGRGWYVSRQSILGHKEKNSLPKAKTEIKKPVPILEKQKPPQIFYNRLKEDKTIKYASESGTNLPELHKPVPKRYSKQDLLRDVAIGVSSLILTANAANIWLPQVAPSASERVNLAVAGAFDRALSVPQNNLASINFAENVSTGWDNLKELVFGKIFFISPAPVNTPRVPKTEVTMVKPLAPSLDLEIVKKEIKSEIDNFAKNQSAPAKTVVYNYAPINLEQISQTEVIHHVYETVSSQSGSDVYSASRAVQSLANGGTLTNSIINSPTISNASLSDPTFSGLLSGQSVLASSSTTLQNFTFVNATGTSATTTTLFANKLDLTQLANGRSIVSASRITDSAPSGDFISYKNAAGNADLFRVDNSGNILAGGITSSGAFTITSVSTPQFRVQYDPSNENTTSVSSAGVSTFAVNGTTPRAIWMPSANRADSFMFQDQSSNEVLRIDTTNKLITFINSTSTNATTTNATSTNLFSTTASSTNLFTNIFSFRLATGTSATTTNFFTTTGSTTNLSFTTASGGNLTLTGTATFPNLLLTGSSTLQNFTFVNATGTNSTTTNSFATTASSTNLFASLLTIAGNGLVVDASRNVGIGTTSPTSLLHVGAGTTGTNSSALTLDSGSGAGGQPLTLFNRNSINKAIIGVAAGTDSGVGGSAADDLFIRSNQRILLHANGAAGTAQMVIQNNGNVGIGTTTPHDMLELNKTSISGPKLYLSNANATSKNAALRFAAGPLSTLNWDITTDYVGNGGTELSIVGSDTQQKMTFLQNGNVGIGTSTPNTKLTVFGDISLGARGQEGGVDRYIGHTAAEALGGNSGWIRFGVSGNDDFLSFSTLKSGVGGGERMRIDPSGNVGIGTSTPAALLDVLGTQVIHNADTGDRLTFSGLATNSGANIYVVNRANDTYKPLNLQASLFAFTQGNVGIGGTPATNVILDVQGNFTTGANQWANYTHNTFTSGGTGTQLGYYVSQATAAAAYTVSNYGGFRADNIALGSGSAVTTQQGFWTTDLTSGTNNYGYRGQVSAGTNKYNLYMDGTAQNYLAGNVGIGTTSPQTILHVAQNGVQPTIVVDNISSGASLGAALYFKKNNVARWGIGSDILANNGTNRLEFWDFTNGASNPRMVVDTSGNVGIGTTTPTSLLHLNSAGNTSINIDRLSSASASQIAFSQASTIRWFLVDRDSSALGTGQTRRFDIFDSIAGAARLSVDNTGNIGIGTTTPQTALSIVNSSGATLTLDKSTGSAIDFTHGGGIRDFLINAISGGGATFNYGSGTTEAMRIDSSGRVGIGNTNPTSLLDVKSTATATTTIRGNNATGNAAILSLADTSADINWNLRMVDASVDGSFRISLGSSGNIGTDLFTILSSGNVGIGVTGPGSILTIPSGATGKIDWNSRGNIVQDANFNYFWSTNGVANAFTLLSASGNIGIGTTTPNIGGQGATRKVLTVMGTTDAAVLELGPSTATNAAGLFRIFGYNGNNLDSYIASDSDSGSKTLSNLAFGTSGSTRMTIDSSGNVGIGTTTPYSKLFVNNPSGAFGVTSPWLAFGYQGNNNYLDMYMDGSGNPNIVSGTNAGTGLYFGSNGATGQLVIKNGGNVGIGTTTPTAQLSLWGAGQTTAALNTEGALGGSLLLTDSGSSAGNGGAIVFGMNNGNISRKFAAIKGQVVDGASNGIGDLAFSTRNAIADSTLTERMRILSSGNVGIGTTNPFLKLSVVGSSQAASVNTVANGILQIMTGTANTDPTLQFGVVNDPSGYAWLQSVIPNTGYRSIVLGPNGGNVGIGTTTPDRLFTVSSNSNTVIDIQSYAASGRRWNLTSDNIGKFKVTDDTGNADRLTIDTSGNVGIGTTTPTSLLHLNSSGNTGINIDRLNSSNASQIAFSQASTIRWFLADRDSGALGTSQTRRFDIFDSIAGAARLSVDNTGNVGIGTTTPASKLNVYGGLGGGSAANSTFDLLTSENSDTDYINIIAPTNKTSGILFSAATRGIGQIRYDHSQSTLYLNANGDRISITSGGAISFNSGLGTGSGGNYLCINTTTYEVLRGNGSSCTASSLRFKQDVENLNYGLADVLKLRPVSYQYKPETNMGAGTKLGFIAEEVNTVIPEVVTLDNEGKVFGLDYPVLTAVLAKAIQELNAKVDAVDLRAASTSLTISTSTPGFVAAVLESIGATINDGVVYIKHLAVDRLTAKEGVVIYDRVTGQPVCTVSENGALKSYPGDCSSLPPPAGTIAYTPPPAPSTDIIASSTSPIDTASSTPDAGPSASSTEPAI